LAVKLGLVIPKNTIITNNYDDLVENFQNEQEKEVIFKILTQLFIPPNKVALTKKIDILNEGVNQQRLEYAPGIFQNQVKRQHDLRITVVGNKESDIKVFCAQIDVKPKTIDWRPYQAEKELWKSAKLEEKINRKLVKFHLSTGLSFGAYDFIIPMDGEDNVEPIFLECNPVGNWLWLEDILKDSYNVTDAIATMLLSD
jgi:hypothetical protein